MTFVNLHVPINVCSWCKAAKGGYETRFSGLKFLPRDPCHTTTEPTCAAA